MSEAVKRAATDEVKSDDVQPVSKKASMEPVIYNATKWIDENKKYFEPPVCNKMMHNDGQMKLFYVGGPNVRKDFHINEGEELFYMVKGDMCLKIVEQQKHRDVIIKQGEIFLLPGRIIHSPQRGADTVGLVIERDRPQHEFDGLRYYVEEDGVKTTEILYEKWFHCDDLGPQLTAVVKAYFETEQYKTGKPVPGTISDDPPLKVDTKTCVQDPFNLHTWIDEHRAELNKKGSIQLFGNGTQMTVDICGKGENSGHNKTAETFIWQIEGSSKVTVDGKEYSLGEQDTMLVRLNQEYTVKQEEGSISLIYFQDAPKCSDEQ